MAMPVNNLDWLSMAALPEEKQHAGEGWVPNARE